MPIVWGTTGSDVLVGTNASETVDGIAGTDTIDGGGGNDTITHTIGSAVISGGTGNDTIVFRNGDGAATATIDGGEGNDLVRVWVAYEGSAATVDLGAGNDAIVVLNNSLPMVVTLGAGRDMVVVDSAGDHGGLVVTDFTAGAGGDVLDLGAYFWREQYTANPQAAPNPFASGHLLLVQDGADTIVRMDVDGFGGGSGAGYEADLLRLENVLTASLTAENLNGWDPNGAAPAIGVRTGTAAGDTLFAHAGGGTVDGAAGDDRLFGGRRDDALVGGAGNDRLDGGTGDDVLMGGDGDDVLDDAFGNDQFDGGAGNDTIALVRSASFPGAPASRSETIAVSAGSGDDFVSLDSINAHSTFYAIHYAVDLGEGADVFHLADQRWWGRLTLGAGVDRIEIGREFLDDDVNFDQPMVVTDFQVGAGGDVFDVQAFIGPMIPESGNPFATGHLRLQQLGADTLVVFDYDGTGPGDGPSYILVLARLEGVSLAGLTAYNFAGYNPSGAAVAGFGLSGTTGADRLRGEAGDDTLSGLAGDDTLIGGFGSDSLAGGDNNDRLDGGAGSDTLDGGNGNDTIVDLSGGDDTILGGAGADTITVAHTYFAGGNETVTIDAGAGADHVSFETAREGTSTIALGTGNDRLTIRNISTGGTSVSTGAGSDVVVLDTYLYGQVRGELTITDFTAGDGGDRLDWLFYARQWLYADGEANPFATGQARLIQSGNDVLLQLTAGTFYPAAGYPAWATPFTVLRLANVQLGALTDFNFGVDISARPPPFTLLGTNGNNVLTGTAIDDLGHGLSGNDTMAGGDGNDTLQGADGNDTVNGDAGNDVLDGGSGIDRLNGGTGGDTITDMHGTDIISGGDGNDVITVDDIAYSTNSPLPPAPGRINAGAGDDDISVRDQWGGYSIVAGAGNDTIRIGVMVGNLDLSLGLGRDTVILQRMPLNGGVFRISDFATGAGGDIFALDDLLTHFLQFMNITWKPGENPFSLGYASLRQVGANVELWLNQDGVPDGFYSWRAVVFENRDLADFTTENFAGADPTAVPETNWVEGSYAVATGASVSLVDPGPRLGVSTLFVGLFDFAFVNNGSAAIETGLYETTAGFVVDVSGRTGASVRNGLSGSLSVVAHAGDAIGFQNESASRIDFDNRGLFEVSAEAGSAWGIVAGFDWYSVTTNRGTMEVTAAIDAVGVYLGVGGFTNSGTITVHAGEYAVGIHANAWQGTVVNKGILTVSTDPGSPWASIGVLLDEYAGAGIFTNSGTITADYAVYIRETNPSGRNADIFHNTGTVNGTVFLNDGDDTLTNYGTMSGATLLGNGADIYYGASGIHTGSIEGGDGDDDITGGKSGEALYGDTGSDRLIGNGGDDWLDGGFGSDLADGGNGFDTLSYLEAASAMTIDLAGGVATGGIDIDFFRNVEAVVGSRGADRVTGSARGDTILGMDGNDVVDGGDGADVLAGGAGRDLITTGSGGDTILFGLGDGIDQILDFAAGDVIEIHGYAGALSVVQSGADVRIKLSSTDLLIVRNTTVAQFTAANLVFSGSPFPFTLADPPSRTLFVSEDLVVGRGAVLEFTDTEPQLLQALHVESEVFSYALQFAGTWSGVQGPGLWNSGTIRYEAFGDEATAAAITGTAFGSPDKALVNRVGGLIEVLAHASDAVGTVITGDLFNAGTVRVTSEAGDATGFYLLDGGTDFVNSGSVFVTAAGRAMGTDEGTTSTGPLRMFNLGSMVVSGQEASVGFDLRMNAHPAAEQPLFVNSGTITVTDATVGKDSVALLVDLGTRVDLWNSGTITADYVLSVGSGLVTDYVHFYNTGQANGNVRLGIQADVVVNAGAITGIVWLGGGADLYDGRQGTLAGTLDGYDGDDTLLAGSGAQTLLGGFGDDVLSGGAGADMLTGGAGRDHFRYAANFGHDTITDFAGGAAGDAIEVQNYSAFQSIAQVGADVLVTFNATNTLRVLNASVADVGAAIVFGAPSIAASTVPSAPAAPVAPRAPTTASGPDQAFDTLGGTAAANRLEGSGADETIAGFGGNDILYGWGGTDQLDGGDGNDLLVGGSGRDTLSGGAGADTFRFDAIADSPGATSASGDRILDFVAADGDRISLAAIDAVAGGANDAFAFVGTAAFSGTAGELRFEQIAGTTHVTGDVDGDALADFTVRLDGLHAMTAADFIL